MNKTTKWAVLSIMLSATVSLAPAAQSSHKRSIAQVDTTAVSKHIMKGHLVREVVDADDLMLKGKYADAADRYHDAMNKDPKNIAAHTGMGLALGKQFKLDAADEEFDKALTLEPQNALAHVGKAMVNIYRLQSSSTTVQKARESMLKEAESQAREALTIDSELPEGHFYLGQALREQNRLDEAAQEFRTAMQAEPNYSEAYSALGMVRLTQNSPVEAQANFKRAVEINSGNSTAHYGLGKVYLQQGSLDNAIHELNTALYQFPNSAPMRLALGQAYLQQGNTVAAVREFQEAIRIKPETSDAYLHIAAIRESRGDVEHAIAELRSGVELMPDNVDLHQRIAEDSLRLEKLDDAMKEYSAVMAANPQNATAAKGLTRALYLKSQKNAAGAYFMSNDFEEAKTVLNKAVAMNPNDLELRLAQAKLRSLSGEPVDLKAVGEPKSDGERIAYAEALLAQNRFPEAHAQMNALINSSTEAKQALAVGDLALMIKDLPSAETAYHKAATMPGGAERAKRGLDQLTKARENSRQDATLASDLARKNALASSIDKYHSAIFGNPEVADTRFGLARALERIDRQSPQNLREAVVQYKAYISLNPTLPPKEVVKLNKHVDQLNDRAIKLEQRIALKPKVTR